MSGRGRDVGGRDRDVGCCGRDLGGRDRSVGGQQGTWERGNVANRDRTDGAMEQRPAANLERGVPAAVGVL